MKSENKKNSNIQKAGGILVQDRKMLVERSHNSDFFLAPGGRIEPGETPTDALIRELKEEFTITVAPEDIELFGTYTADATGAPGKKIHMYVFTVHHWQGIPQPDHEVEEIRWIDSADQAEIKVGSIIQHEILPRLKAEGIID